MRKLWTRILGLGTLVALFLPGIAMAAGGGGAAPVVIVSDTRKLSGAFAWWANLYNESHVYFTIATVIIIPLIGVIFGMLADVVMKHVGIDLEHRDLAEH
jgi:hypothetical protein